MMQATYVAKADILNESRVEAHTLSDLLQQGIGHELKGSVLETALLALAKRRADGRGDHDIVGILGCAVRGSAFRRACREGKRAARIVGQ